MKDKINTCYENIFEKYLTVCKEYGIFLLLWNYQTNVKIFKALSNEQRLKIFKMIREGCCSPDGKVNSGFRIENKACCPVAG